VTDYKSIIKAEDENMLKYMNRNDKKEEDEIKRRI